MKPLESYVSQWCNPVTLQPEQSGEQALIPSVEPRHLGVEDSVRPALLLRSQRFAPKNSTNSQITEHFRNFSAGIKLNSDPFELVQQIQDMFLVVSCM